MQTLARILAKIFWFMAGQCVKCGGDISPHIDGDYYCDECGARN